MQTKPLTIGQVASQTGLGVETVRFYERQGLIPEPSRRASGYRQYGEDTVDRLRFIRRAKDLGFTLAEIKSLLTLRVDETSTAADVKRQAEEKITDIDSRIRSLQKMRKTLKQLADSCHGAGPLSDCPILGALEGRSAKRKQEHEVPTHDCH